MNSTITLINPYNDLFEAQDGLFAQGYNMNFNLENDLLTYQNQQFEFSTSDFVIESSYAFCAQNQKVEAVISAISSNQLQLKGFIISDCLKEITAFN